MDIFLDKLAEENGVTLQQYENNNNNSLLYASSLESSKVKYEKII